MYVEIPDSFEEGLEDFRTRRIRAREIRVPSSARSQNRTSWTLARHWVHKAMRNMSRLLHLKLNKQPPLLQRCSLQGVRACAGGWRVGKAPSTEADHAATSSVSSSSESMTETPESSEGTSSSIEEQIELSKDHWSELAQLDSNLDVEDEEAVRADNEQVFKVLQMHPSWGSFFRTFDEISEKYGSLGRGKYSFDEVVLGKKFAEGGQAELYEAQVKWKNRKYNERDLKIGTKWVLKVFRKGTVLRHLQSQWPHGLLQFHAEKSELSKARKGQYGDFIIPRRYNCDVFAGMLMRDGRFAFLMVREEEDLRSYINRCMKWRICQDLGPFSKEEAERIMYNVALGMDWLHGRNIIHRDLKASNVLCTKWNRWNDGWACYVADFECSIGVIGTGFFRAPEILQACKDGNASSRFELFTKKADVYSYGMTCYEILTGKLPFEGHSHRNYDFVLGGGRPEVPEYVGDWIHELLGRCWQFNPKDRPTFGEILRILEAKSPAAETLRIRMLEIEDEYTSRIPVPKEDKYD